MIEFMNVEYNDIVSIPDFYRLLKEKEIPSGKHPIRGRHTDAIYVLDNGNSSHPSGLIIQPDTMVEIKRRLKYDFKTVFKQLISFDKEVVVVHHNTSIYSVLNSKYGSVIGILDNNLEFYTVIGGEIKKLYTFDSEDFEEIIPD